MKTAKRKKTKDDAKVILADFSLDRQFARQVLLGFNRHTPLRGLWVLQQGLFSRGDDRDRLRSLNPVGMISMRRPRKYAPFARRYGLTAVGVGVWASTREFAGLPYVDIDPVAIGEMAAEYFVNRGFRNFGMIGSGQTFHCPYRGDAFVEALRRRKLTCDVFDPRGKCPECGEPLSAVTGSSETMRRWLATLAKPLGLFCIDDDVGLWICEVCRRTGVRVPEEVAVLGVEDDDVFCNLSHPHLSSIAVPGEQVGREAAKLLDAVLRGRKAPKRPILLPPIGVTTRQSTDVLAVEDPYVVRAVRYIRERACDGIRAEDVMKHVRLSRRPLERRFKKVLGCGPFAEIRRVQIERFKALLSQTDKTLEAIAPECGFDSITHMNLAFKKATGMTPGAWRKQFRSRSG